MDKRKLWFPVSHFDPGSAPLKDKPACRVELLHPCLGMIENIGAAPGINRKVDRRAELSLDHARSGPGQAVEELGHFPGCMAGVRLFGLVHSIRYRYISLKSSPLGEATYSCSFSERSRYCFRIVTKGRSKTQQGNKPLHVGG